MLASCSSFGPCAGRRAARLRRLVAGSLITAAMDAATAHDTWFQSPAENDAATLTLGTGDRFPVLESRVEFEYLRRHGCAPQSALAQRGAAAGRALTAVGGPAGRLPTALTLRLPGAVAKGEPAAPYSCWTSLVPFDIEIEPPKVEQYLKEIAAGPALRAAWAAEQAAGRPWRERFVKHARLDVGALSAAAVGMPLEALIVRDVVPKVGQELRFQILHDGRPLVGHPVELVSELSKLGLWRQTDAQGQFTITLPLAGNWLLRSTLLRPPAQPFDRWQSDFVTLAFNVGPAAR